MLTAAERVHVQAALATVLSGQQNPRDLVPVIFGNERQQVLGTLNFLPDAASYADAIMTICILSRWTRTPALLESLLVYLVEQRGVGALQPFVDRVRARIDPNPDPYKAFWLATKRPFFDRKKLRECVQHLVEDDAAPILRIQAPSESFGRSYSREFIEHVAAQFPGDTRVTHAAISQGTGPTYDLVDLAGDIVSHLGVTEQPPARSTSSYARAIARFILSHLISRPGRWIVVLDGFGQPDLNAEVREAIEIIASMIPTGEYRARVRLILIDYPQALPQVSAADVLQEDLVPAAQLTEEDLEPAVAAIGELRVAEGRPPLEAAELPLVMAKIFDAAPAGGKERLVAFNTALVKVWTFQREPPP